MNVPNILTILRIALIPLFCYFVFDLNTSNTYVNYHPDTLIIAGIIFIFASSTDFFDGYLARKLRQETNAGKLMDPLADKILITAALIALVEWKFIPGWSVVIILSREFMITGLRSLLTEVATKSLGASSLGKAKTFSQMSAIILILFDFEEVGIYVYYFSVVLALVSAAEYIYKSWKYINFK